MKKRLYRCWKTVNKMYMFLLNLQQAWQKPKYKHRAVNILRLVERMNNLTLWVATTILSQRVRLFL